MLETRLGPLVLANPIMSASGTFGSGWEGRAFEARDGRRLAAVGAVVSKTVTVRPRAGNPPPRILETAAGMLNSIGLENRGADVFLRETLPRMRELGPRVIVNIGGESIAEFIALAVRFCAAGVDALEINLSCPNVQGGRLHFSTMPAMTERAVREVKAAVDPGVPVFAKLSPNVTDITEIARAAEQGGADGITAINTLIGMAIDWRRRRPRIGMRIAGLSGPAIKPVALRMVNDIARVVRVPIIGVGGINTAEDILEFLVAGASAVQIGTANFVDPARMPALIGELERLLLEAGTDVASLVNTLEYRAPDAATQEEATA